MATRWRFGGGSVAPRGRFVTGRRRLVGASLRIATGVGGAPQRGAGRFGADRHQVSLRIAKMQWRSVYESPCTPSTNHHAMAIRLRITMQWRSVYESPHGPPLAPWRSANESPYGSMGPRADRRSKSVRRLDVNFYCCMLNINIKKWPLF